jgi:hypothetical protein
VRRLDRLVALVLGLAMAGAAVLTGIETMLLVLGEPSLVVPRSTWAHEFPTLQWNDGNLELAAGIVAGVGALLLLAQLVPRRKVRLLLRTGAIAGTWLSRKGLNRKIAFDAGLPTQIDETSARVGRRRVTVRAVLVPGVEAAEGRALLEAAVAASLARWPLAEPLRIKVKVSTTELPVGPASDVAVPTVPASAVPVPAPGGAASPVPAPTGPMPTRIGEQQAPDRGPSPGTTPAGTR